MLNDEINRRNGVISESEEEVNTNNQPFLNVSSHIKNSYVRDNDLKIEIHRLINSIDSEDSFNNVINELTDRFGKPDIDTINYMYEEWFENVSRPYIERVRETRNFIEILFKRDMLKKIDMEQLFISSFKISPLFRFQKRGENLVIILDTVRLEGNSTIYLIKLMELIKSYLTLDVS
jgi:transcription-repair coupling factor (superfamily II helicase)